MRDSGVRTLNSRFGILVGILFINGVCGCTNNRNPGANTPSVTNAQSGIQVPSDASNLGSFALTQVVRSSSNPTSVIDLIGDNSGTYGTLCSIQNGQSGTQNQSGGSTQQGCNCIYAYNTPTHPNVQLEVPVIYSEANLLRCSLQTVSADVTTMNVTIHALGNNTFSNAVKFQFLSSAGNFFLDPLDIKSFVQPIRYQCRDIFSIPYLFDGTVYDPYQSEDPHLSYPFDFYTSNLALATNYFVSGQSASNWDCPPILTPTTYLTPTTTFDYVHDFNISHNLNMRLFSLGQVAGSDVIFPLPPKPYPTGFIDRSTFYLAKQSVGAFNVAVNAYIAPGAVSGQSITFSSGATATIPPLGYGASPIPTGNDTETCPDTNVMIPSGYHWVKVWLFRGSQVERHYLSSQTLINQVKNILCNPGDWADGNPAYPGCQKSRTNSGSSFGLKDFQNPSIPNIGLHHFADRVWGDIQCSLLDDNNANATYCNGHPGASCNPDGFDRWIPQAASSLPNQAGCNPPPSSRNDPLNLCTNGGGVPQPRIPSTSSLNLVSLDIDPQSHTANARYDFLFVVTPPSISTRDMKNTSSSSPAYHYMPKRYYIEADCPPGKDPLNGDCSDTSLLMPPFYPRFYDVTANSDGGSPIVVFPVCALQPN